MCRVQSLRGAVERERQDRQLLSGAGLVFGIDSLIDSWDNYGSVAGELAGSVDGVPVPWAIGQACCGDESGLSLAEGLIEFGQVS